MTSKILYVDMDNVLVDFPSGIARVPDEIRASYEDRLDEVPGIFGLMEPMPNAIESYEFLSQYFDTYILSTAPWHNRNAWSDKLQWVQKLCGLNLIQLISLTHSSGSNPSAAARPRLHSWKHRYL